MAVTRSSASTAPEALPGLMSRALTPSVTRLNWYWIRPAPLEQLLASLGPMAARQSTLQVGALLVACSAGLATGAKEIFLFLTVS